MKFATTNSIVQRCRHKPCTSLEGGPFVTAPGGKDAIEREPRVRTPENPPS